MGYSSLDCHCGDLSDGLYCGREGAPGWSVSGMSARGMALDREDRTPGGFGAPRTPIDEVGVILRSGGQS
jgi:hypothetical protein